VLGVAIVDVTLAVRDSRARSQWKPALHALCLVPKQSMSSHVMPEMGNAAAEALEAALSSSVGGVTVDTLPRIWTKP
jgi:hypothetical protein